MHEVRRVPEEVSGVSDGVALEVNGVYTKFLDDKMGQQVVNCKMLASWETGVLSINFTAGGQRQGIGVMLAELMELLKEASAARMEQGGTAGAQNGA